MDAVLRQPCVRDAPDHPSADDARMRCMVAPLLLARACAFSRRSAAFANMQAVQNQSMPQGFAPYLSGAGEAMGCIVNTDRKLAYKALLYVIPSAAGLAGGVFRLPNSFVVPIVGGCVFLPKTTM